MTTNYSETRIGTLLINKGLISKAQLNAAIDEQQKRKQIQLETGPSPTMHASTVIGEILVDLGFITSRQLKLTLTKQKLLRKVAFALTVTAPLLTGCGGGSGGSDSEETAQSRPIAEVSAPSENTTVNTPSTTTPSTSQPTTEGSETPVVVVTPPPIIIDDEDSSSSQLGGLSSTRPSYVGGAVNRPSSSDEATPPIESEGGSSDIEDELAEESPSPEEEDTPVATDEDGSITINWNTPSTRENGDPLNLSEIAGYQILLENLDTGSFQYIYVSESDLASSSYTIENLAAGSYQVSIAVVDEDGLYSDFTTPVGKAIAA
ncbi:MAG: hypothetical protein K6L73_11190 [Cellvibrionaceae bacterium]